MDKKSTHPLASGSVAPVSARLPAAAPRAATGRPASEAGDGSEAAASRLRCLDEVVRQVKVELERGQGHRRGSNPYDSLLGRPNRDVWGTGRRA